MSLKVLLIASVAAMALAAPAPTPVEKRQTLTGETKNDIVNGSCKPVSFFFARGTTEGGNMGETVGPALETALAKIYGAGNLAVQGATYPADVEDTYIGSTDPGSAQGATFMAKYIKQIKSTCASTKVVLGGYSQGAQQVHGALIDVSEGMVDVSYMSFVYQYWIGRY